MEEETARAKALRWERYELNAPAEGTFRQDSSGSLLTTLCSGRLREDMRQGDDMESRKQWLEE